MRTLSPDLILAVSIIAGGAFLVMFVFLCLNVSGIRRELERQGRERREQWGDDQEPYDEAAAG